MEINKYLHNLYDKYWQSFIANAYVPNMGTKNAISYPFLISASKHYCKAKFKIMICGQETYGWGGKEFLDYKKASVDKIIDVYEAFINKKSTGTIKKPGYNSPFWNFSWKIMKCFPEVGFVFQNIIKIGKFCETGSSDTIFELSQNYFPVFTSEMNILKPDIIILFTGKYDNRINSVIGNFKTKRLNPPKITNILFDELLFENPNVPKAIRTSHPGYIQRRGLYNPMVEEIKSWITSSITSRGII